MWPTEQSGGSSSNSSDHQDDTQNQLRRTRRPRRHDNALRRKPVDLLSPLVLTLILSSFSSSFFPKSGVSALSSFSEWSQSYSRVNDQPPKTEQHFAHSHRGFLGCLYSDKVCNKQETCFDDQIFGRCVDERQEEEEAEEFSDATPLSNDDVSFLTYELERLLGEGLEWTDIYTQCTVQNALKNIQLGVPFDESSCSMFLQTSLSEDAAVADIPSLTDSEEDDDSSDATDDEDSNGNPDLRRRRGEGDISAENGGELEEEENPEVLLGLGGDEESNIVPKKMGFFYNLPRVPRPRLELPSRDDDDDDGDLSFSGGLNNNNNNFFFELPDVAVDEVGDGDSATPYISVAQDRDGSINILPDTQELLDSYLVGVGDGDEGDFGYSVDVSGDVAKRALSSSAVGPVMLEDDEDDEDDEATSQLDNIDPETLMEIRDALISSGNYYDLTDPESSDALPSSFSPSGYLGPMPPKVIAASDLENDDLDDLGDLESDLDVYAPQPMKRKRGHYDDDINNGDDEDSPNAQMEAAAAADELLRQQWNDLSYPHPYATDNFEDDGDDADDDDDQATFYLDDNLIDAYSPYYYYPVPAAVDDDDGDGEDYDVLLPTSSTSADDDGDTFEYLLNDDEGDGDDDLVYLFPPAPRPILPVDGEGVAGVTGVGSVVRARKVGGLGSNLFNRNERLDVKKPGPFYKNSANNFFLDKLMSSDYEDGHYSGSPFASSNKQKNDSDTDIGQLEYEMPLLAPVKDKRLLVPVESESPEGLEDQDSSEDGGRTGHYVHIGLNKRFDTWRQGEDLIDYLTAEFGLPRRAVTDEIIENQHVQFRVEPNPKNIDAFHMAKKIDEDTNLRNNIDTQLGVEVGRAASGNRGDVSRVLFPTGANLNLLILVVVSVSALAALCVIGVVLLLVKKKNRINRKKQEIIEQERGKANDEYQQLCRDWSRSSKKIDPSSSAGAAAGATGASGSGASTSTAPPANSAKSKLQQRESKESEGSSRSSTSSWSEEPNNTNMDISTGHMVLAYMEDHLKNKQRLEQEWVALCGYEAEPCATTIAFKAENKKKNRYPDKLPYDHNRVILNAMVNGSNSDYINASTVTDHDPRNPSYIVTQAPLQNTVADFWQMVWEQGCVVIVMLTRLQDNAHQLCHRYWPEKGSEQYHIFEVHLVSEHVWCEDYLVRSVYLKNTRTGETRTVTQFHFRSWPAHGVPTSTKALLEFRRKVNKSYRGRSCPICVHCSDGVGRSGTYTLIDMVLNRMSKGCKEIDIAATLEHIRDQRGGMVQTRQQFEFCLMAVAEEVHAILKAMPQ